MEQINSILKKKNVDNVNVEESIYNNVNVEALIRRIQEAIDKPKAVGEILAVELNAPQNKKFYIKLAYQYPPEILFECLALAREAEREHRIRTDIARYFYGILKKKRL